MTTSRGRLRRAPGYWSRRLGRADGFTIIETLVAALVLVVGLIATFTALDLAAQTSFTTRAREGAVNLAREITEDARALPYASLTSSSAVTTQLQSMPGLASSSQNGWTILRRCTNGSGAGCGISYTVTVTESDIPAVTQQNISEKQITVNLQWKVEHVTRSYSQTATISSAGEGIGLDSSGLQWANPSNCNSPCTVTAPVISASMGVSSMTFQVQTPANISGVLWQINGVTQSWTSTYAVNNLTQWTWTTNSPGWSISNLPDGVYTIGAAAQNGTQTGPMVKMTVRLARGIPSAPSFNALPSDGYGFNANLYSGGSKTASPVGEFDWSGSNSVAQTGNQSDANVVGYQLTTPGGKVCNMMLANQTYPSNCAADASIWCSRATACIDLAAPSPTSSPAALTYQVAALYYNASNVLTAGPATSSILTGTTAQSYYLGTTTANTSTNCPSSTKQQDLSAATPSSAGSLASTGSTVTAAFCGPAFSQPTTIGTGGSASVYFTNSSSSSCTVTGTVSLDGFLALPSVSVSVPTGSSTDAFNWASGGTWSANSGDRIDTRFSWGCGSSTKPVTMNWGTGNLSTFTTSVFPVQAPNPPTSLSVTSVTSNPDGSTNATLQWNAPTSGVPVQSYRVYRDGQNYTNRIYFDAASNLCSGGVCTWTDHNRSGTHTYYVTAVGNTTAGSDMAESSAAGPTSAQ